MKHMINGLFPSPAYLVKRDSNLDLTEEKEIEDIIKEGMRKNTDNSSNSSTHNNNIFDTKLKNIKEFCEQHIETYVKEIINPTAKLIFSITQSWINVTRPGEQHQKHYHQNSIISGVFYVSTVENDIIQFYDPAANLKARIEFDTKENNIWNSTIWNLPVEKNNLLLFPSWLEHSVVQNTKQTKDRISISFNVFVEGLVGISKSGRGTII